MTRDSPRVFCRLGPQEWRVLCEYAAKNRLVAKHGEFIIGDIVFSPSIYPSTDIAKLQLAEAELDRLRGFVQWVADHSSDPDIVEAALRHGAEA